MLVYCWFRYLVILKLLTCTGATKTCLKFSRYLSGIKLAILSEDHPHCLKNLAIGGKMLVFLKIFCTLRGEITLQKMDGIKKKNFIDAV